MTQKHEFEIFGNDVDAWTKYQFKRAQKHIFIAYKKTAKFTKTVINHDWKNEAFKAESVFFANKAIYFGASNNLPFKTLVLLGKLLGDKEKKESIKEIISSNVVKFDGSFIKLDDLDLQAKVRKVLRTNQYDRFETEDIAA